MTSLAESLAPSLADQIAERLIAEIPGLEARVRSHGGVSVVEGRYACPCGEISGFAQGIAGYRDVLERGLLIDFFVDHIKHMLREHVRGEGNEPNF